MKMKTVSFKVNQTNNNNFNIAILTIIFLTAENESLLSFSVKDISFGESTSDSNYQM